MAGGTYRHEAPGIVEARFTVMHMEAAAGGIGPAGAAAAAVAHEDRLPMAAEP
jgi:hypothetical protein